MQIALDSLIAASSANTYSIWPMVVDSRVWQLFGITAKLALASLLIAAPPALWLGFLLGHRRVCGTRFWETCLVVLLFMPLYVQVAGWEAGFGRGGWYSTLIAQKLSAPLLDGFWGAAWVHAMAAIPWMFWFVRLGFASVSAELDDATKLDGSRWQFFHRVAVPLALPAIVAAVLFLLVTVATEITVTDVYQVRTYAEELYNGFVLGTDFGDLPLRAAPIMIAMWVLVGCGAAICRLFFPTVLRTSSQRPRVRSQSFDWVSTVVVAATVAVLLVVPVCNLLYQAGIEVRQSGMQRERIWSVSKLLQILIDSPVRFRQELAWTAILAQLSALAAVGTALLLTLWGLRGKVRAWIFAILAIFAYSLPGPFIGFGIIRLLNRPESEFSSWLYDNTIFAPWLALTVRAFPFAYLILWFGLRRIPTQLYESSQIDGASSWSSTVWVLLPQLMPSLLCAGLATLAIAAADLSACVLVIPPGVTTVSSRIFNLVHYGAEDSLAGLCLTNMVFMTFLALLTRQSLLGFSHARAR